MLLLDLEPQRLWDLGTGETLRTLKSHTSTVNAVAVTPDGRHAVSALDCPNAATLRLGQRPDNPHTRRPALIVAFRRLAPFLTGVLRAYVVVFLFTLRDPLRCMKETPAPRKGLQSWNAVAAWRQALIIAIMGPVHSRQKGNVTPF